MVPESYDREALRAKPCIASDVISTFSMLRSVAFNDDPTFEADEIDDEIADGELTPPFRLGEPPIAQKTPERFLRLRCLNAHRFRANFCEGRDRTMKSWHRRFPFH